MKFKQAIIWTLALLVGAALGMIGSAPLNSFMDFVASAYTRCFQFVAVPTVALAILTAMSSLGEGRAMGRVFVKTFTFTVLTSLVASLVGLGLYLIVQPGTIDPDAIAKVSAAAQDTVNTLAKAPDTVYGHILNAIPNNLVNPFLTGNVLPVVFISAAIGITIAVFEKKSENVKALHKCLCGLQEVFFGMIKGLIWALPVGIVAFAAQHNIWRVRNGELSGYTTKAVMLMIGTNNNYGDNPSGVAAGIKQLLADIREKQPAAKIVLCPVFPRGEKPTDKMRQQNAAVNAIIKNYADGKDVLWLDFTDKYLQADGTISKDLMPDFLHPKEEGYRIWAEAARPLFKAICGK